MLLLQETNNSIFCGWAAHVAVSTECRRDVTQEDRTPFLSAGGRQLIFFIFIKKKKLWAAIIDKFFILAASGIRKWPPYSAASGQRSLTLKISSKL